MVVACHVHIDRELAVELDRLQGSRIEALQVEIGLVGEVLHPLEQLSGLGLRGEDLQEVIELLLEVGDLLLELGQLRLDGGSAADVAL